MLNLNLTTKLSVINFTEDKILKIIRSLNINEAYDHDDISIRMVKVCGKAILEPLSVIYKNCTNKGIFLDSWKKSNIVPVHKKGGKRLLENDILVSLLLMLSKSFSKNSI